MVTGAKRYKTFDSIYLCGPEEMIFSASAYFEKLGILKNNIHFELFTTPGQSMEKKALVAVNEKEQGEKSAVSVKLDGRTIDFQLVYYILTAYICFTSSGRS